MREQAALVSKVIFGEDKFQVVFWRRNLPHSANRSPAFEWGSQSWLQPPFQAAFT
jgi:hypothetical protein